MNSCVYCLLQDYCKDWAEQLIVSVVLICSESKAPQMMRGSIAICIMLHLQFAMLHDVLKLILVLAANCMTLWSGHECSSCMQCVHKPAMSLPAGCMFAACCTLANPGGDTAYAILLMACSMSR